MPNTRLGSSNQEDDEGSSHLIECTGKGQNGQGCVAWVPTWLPKRIPKGFLNRPFLCGFCAASEVSQLCEKQSQVPEKSSISVELSSLFNADSNEQYGRRDNVRIFGVKEETNEDVYQKVIDVAEKTGYQISKTDFSVCYRVPSRNEER